MLNDNTDVCEGVSECDSEAGEITTEVVDLLERIEALLEEHRQSALSGPALVRLLKGKTQALLCEFGFAKVHPVIRFRQGTNGNYAGSIRFLAYSNTFFWSQLKVEVN